MYIYGRKIQFKNLFSTHKVFGSKTEMEQAGHEIGMDWSCYIKGFVKTAAESYKVDSLILSAFE